jgi:U3 small nucleolar RNA-associated protein 18
MVKHARKRQRKEANAAPLGTRVELADDAGKDDEERRLESILFGTPYVPAGKSKEGDLLGYDSQEDVEGTGAELEAMLDADVSQTAEISITTTIFSLICLFFLNYD